MKIVCLCLKHRPKDQRVYYKISKALKVHGHEVINIHPNTENMVTEDGIQILGYPQKQGWWGRIQSFNNLRMAALGTNPDIIIAAEPDSLFVANGIKKSRKNTKIIFDCHEWYGEHFNIRIKNTLLKKLLRRLITWWINGMVKSCDAVISVNNTMAQYYAQHNPNSHTIPSIADVLTSPDINVTRKDFIYFGRFLSSAQEDILLDAAKILKERGCDDVRILVIGGSEQPDTFRLRIKELNVSDNISILNWMARDQAFRILNEGYAGIMRFDMQTYGLPALPNKIFEYMAAGMAVIGCRLNPEIAKIIDEENCGISIPDETPEALANAIQYLNKNREVCSQMGQNSLRAVQATYNWNHYGTLLNNIILKVSHGGH